MQTLSAQTRAGVVSIRPASTLTLVTPAVSVTASAGDSRPVCETWPVWLDASRPIRPGRETEGKAACLWDDGRCETGAGDKGRVDSTAGGAVPARAEEQGWGVRPLRRGAEGGAKDQEKRKSGRRGERDRSTRAVAEADAGTESPSV